MALEIQVSDFCDQATISKGRLFYDTYGISHRTRARSLSGAWRITGKAADSFNFVNHPWLITDASGRKILEFGCDCPETKGNVTMCEHCVALGLAFGGQAEKPPSEQEEPASESKQEPEVVAEESPEPPTPEAVRSMEILFGHCMQDNSPLYWHPNDTERVFHTNVGVIGTMGTGKTQFTKSLVTQLYRSRHDNYNGRPMGILIFDYKGDYNETKTDFVNATNARVLKPYRLPYNPLALNRTKAFKPLLPMHTANEFKTTIAKIFNLGPKQQQLLLECIVKAFDNQGIDPVDAATWNRRAPTIDQVYQIFAKETVGRPVDSLNAAMDNLHQFCLFESDPRRAVSLEQLLNGVTVIDISGYDKNIQSLIVAITLNQFYAQMQAQGSSMTDGQYRHLRSIILVDEADDFMGQDFPSLRRILKEGREFGVGVILSTQSLSHFVGGEDDYSRYVLTWVVHNVGDLKQKDVEYVFKLPPKSEELMANYSAIKELRKHESIVKLNNDPPVAIRDKAFWRLYQEMPR